MNSAHSFALEFLEAPSDLVPGVYEGGLKTWECSLDLVDYLDQIRETEMFRGIRGKRVLEVRPSTILQIVQSLHSGSGGLWNSPPYLISSARDVRF